MCGEGEEWVMVGLGRARLYAKRGRHVLKTRQVNPDRAAPEYWKQSGVEDSKEWVLSAVGMVVVGGRGGKCARRGLMR